MSAAEHEAAAANTTPSSEVNVTPIERDCWAARTLFVGRADLIAARSSW